MSKTEITLDPHWEVQIYENVSQRVGNKPRTEKNEQDGGFSVGFRSGGYIF